MTNINKNGTVSGTILLEYIKEPDGSIWEPVFYHNNPSVNLFSSSDDFANGVVKSKDLFFNFNICKELTSWEFLVIQKPTSNSAYVKYRWIQTNNPLTTTATSGVSVVSGYNSAGGGLCRCNSATYLARTNTTNNWWEAIGSWTAYQGGIPGMADIVVTTGSIAVFTRVSIAKTKIYPETGIVVSNNLIQE